MIRPYDMFKAMIRRLVISIVVALLGSKRCSWLLFCIAFHIVNALPTIASAIVVVIMIDGRAITLEREPSKNKQRTDTKRMQRGLRVIPLQGAIEKSPILLSQYWKNERLDGTIIISYFGGSNSIFADCIDDY